MTENRLAGRTTLVTGATRGIGAAIAQRFGKEGANVVVTGINPDEGQSVVEEIRERGGAAVYESMDVRSPDDVTTVLDGVIEHFGSCDTLVNNAAIQSAATADELEMSEWTKIVETNLRGPWLCAREMVRRVDDGCIINVSSNHALTTMPAHFPYNVTKAGVEAMTRAMCLEFGPAIRVNTVRPGWVAVDRTTSDLSESERRRLASLHPVGRIGRPDDVAAAVAYLASDEAAFIDGASIPLDGGRGAVMQDYRLPDYAALRRGGDSL